MFLFVSERQADWQLADTQIDIWRFSLNTDPASLPDCLNEQEITRANRFYFKKHQQRFYIARATIRVLLGRYLGIPPQDIQFEYDAGGKPSIVTPTPIRFNLSHTGEYACFAVGLNTQVGIDIERYSVRNYLGIAKHVFSETEQQHLHALPDYLLPMAFFSLWSQKEAVIKCNGLGMRYPLQQLTLPIFSEQGHVFTDVIDKQKRQLQRFTPFLGTAAALCCHPNVSHIRCFER